MLKNKKGFTLIELIIVVAIMAVLIALLAPNVMKYLDKSKVSKDLSTLDSVKIAFNAEIMDEDVYGYCTDANYGKEGNDALLAGKTIEDLAAEDIFTPAIFGDVLDDGVLAASDVFECKAAQGAVIKVYLDGKGGVAVAAVKDDKVVEYEDGKYLYVESGLLIGETELNPEVEGAGEGE